jgi:chromosome partitioning protein
MPGGTVLKKGRGLRKRRGEPEVAEPAAPQPPPSLEDEAVDDTGGAPPASLAETESPGEAASAVEAPESEESTVVESSATVPGIPVEAGGEEPLPPVEASTSDAPPGPVLETTKLPAPPGGGVRPMELPRVLAVANQKGGVGKTTTTVNLGAALAELGFRVLVLDLDPQGNATTGLGLNPRDVEGSVYDVLLADVTLADIIEPTSLKNLFVAPATIDLAGAEIELVPVMSRELRLRKAIDEIRDDYDIVMIDCPPSLGLLTVNGLAASDDVIVPIQCEYYALEGLGQLLRNVGLVQANLNPGLDVRGIILTMYDARTKLADQVVSEVRAYFGEKVYETVVPRTVRLSEAPSFGQPIIVFDPTSRGAKAYRDLAKEVSRGASRRSG